MKRNKLKIYFKRHGYIITVGVCCAAILVLSAVYELKGRNNEETDKYLADINKVSDYVEKTDDDEKKDESVTANSKQTVNIQNDTKKNEEKNKEKEDEQKEPAMKEEPEEKATKKTKTFTDTRRLAWPVEGNVIMNYSMDKSVYFATLKQYKYNPALIIGAGVNTKVVAAGPGQVKEIQTTAETGGTIKVDMGNGYVAYYGQLKDIQVSEGSNINTGDLIGYINEPTKYYAVEGSNLYFEMQKNEEPINPMIYLE